MSYHYGLLFTKIYWILSLGQTLGYVLVHRDVWETVQPSGTFYLVEKQMCTDWSVCHPLPQIGYPLLSGWFHPEDLPCVGPQFYHWGSLLCGIWLSSASERHRFTWQSGSSSIIAILSPKAAVFTGLLYPITDAFIPPTFENSPCMRLFALCSLMYLLLPRQNLAASTGKWTIEIGKVSAIIEVYTSRMVQ